MALASFLLVSCSGNVSSSSSFSSLEGQASSEASSSSALASSEVTSSEEISSAESSSSDESAKQPIDVASPVSDDFLALFDPLSRVSVRLEFSNEAMFAIHRLQSTPDSRYNDFYFPAKRFSVSLGGETHEFDDVGVRMRGASSRYGFTNEQGKIYIPVSFKVSLKATFDDPEYLTDENLMPFYHDWEGKSKQRKERKNRNLFGLEKMNFRKLPRAGTDMVLKETYCYQVFRQNNMLAPYSNTVGFSLLSETDEWNGYYELIEPIDKEFLKRRFSKAESKGDLYKCVHPQIDAPANLIREGAVYTEGENAGKRIPKGLIGVEDNYASYRPSYQLKTNDDGENSDFSAMENLINMIWEVAYNGGSFSHLTNAIDLNSFMRYSALSYLLGSPDDFRWSGNNYYLYFLPSTGKAIFIPYDYDFALGTVWDETALPLVYCTPFFRPIEKTDYSPLLFATYLLPAKEMGLNMSFSPGPLRAYFDTLVHGLADRALNSNAYSSLCEQTGHSEDKDSVLKYFSKKRQILEA